MSDKAGFTRTIVASYRGAVVSQFSFTSSIASKGKTVTRDRVNSASFADVENKVRST